MNVEENVIDSPIVNTKRGDLYSIDHRNIEVEEGFNSRIDYGDLDELAESIIANGQLDPCIVFKKRGEETYVLTEGHRRFAAIKIANGKGHNILVKAILGSNNIEDRLLAQVITGTGKKPLNPVEEADVYKRLVNYGYEAKDIQEKTRKSLGHIYNMLRLADAPMKVKKAITSGEISATTVMGIIRTEGNAEQVIAVVEQAIDHAKGGGNDTGTTKAKATIKNVQQVTKTLTPLQKLGAAHDLLGSGEKADFLEAIINLLNDKNSTAEQVAELFK